MITRISDWGGCTPLTGENNYSRNPFTGSYPGSSKKIGVSSSEKQGICNVADHVVKKLKGVCTSELQGICNVRDDGLGDPSGVCTSELDICNIIYG